MTARTAGVWVTYKGLRSGTLSLGENVVIAVTSVAPAYSLAAALAALVAVAGPKTPSLFIVGFVPVVFTALAFRELARDAPDCGSTFTWATRAFGPWVGWIGGWALVISATVAVGNAAQVAAVYLLEALDLDSLAHSAPTRIAVGGAAVVVVVALFALRWRSLEPTERSRAAAWLLVAEVALLVLVGVAALVALSPRAHSTATQLAVGGSLVAVLVVLCLRGIDGTQRYQAVLLAVELLMLLVVSAFALAKVYTHHAGPQAVLPQWSWLLPTGLSASHVASGTILCVFAYWGWDAPLSVAEEAENPRKNPGRAAILATFILCGTYVLVSVALQAFAGFGATGIGLTNPAHANDALSVLGDPVLGGGLAVLLLLAISSSSLGAVLTYAAPTARTVLAMAVYRAVPRRFALVHRHYQTPWVATVVIGAGGFAIYSAMTLLSQNSLPDMVSSLALVTTFYYALTAYACVWTFGRRGELFDSVRNFWVRGALPLLGALAMTGAFVKTAIDSFSPTYGKSHFGPVGGVFIMGVGLLVLGVPVAVLYAKGENLKAFLKASFTGESRRAVATNLKELFNGQTGNAFFRGETLNAKTRITDVEQWLLAAGERREPVSDHRDSGARRSSAEAPRGRAEASALTGSADD